MPNLIFLAPTSYPIYYPKPLVSHPTFGISPSLGLHSDPWVSYLLWNVLTNQKCLAHLWASHQTCSIFA